MSETLLTQGTMILFKEWDAMVVEYGLEDDNIDCKYTFVPKMKGLCGKLYELTWENSKSLAVNEHFDLRGWTIGTDMFTVPNDDDISNEMEYVNIEQVSKRFY